MEPFITFKKSDNRINTLFLNNIACSVVDPPSNFKPKMKRVFPLISKWNVEELRLCINSL